MTAIMLDVTEKKSKKQKAALPEVLINSDGKEIPIGKVRPDHLRRHNTVLALFAEIEGLETKLERAKKKQLKAIVRYQNWLAKKNKIDADFSNLQLSDYPNLHRVQIKQGEVIEFGEQIQFAKELIDKCFQKWGQGANENLKMLVDGLFKVNKKGFIDRASIVKLWQFNIKDADWNKAMELIKQSMQVTGLKKYLFFQYREHNKAEWKTVNLNYSTMDVEV